MAQSAGLHESADRLQPATVDRHRAIVSVQEELEAIDWYDQRVDAADDAQLAAVLAHNRDEEKEHAAMTLEWLRRHDPVLDRHLRTYLFSENPILEIEAVAGAGADAGTEAEDPVPAPGGPGGGLGIGDLRS